jgi:YegS/Rv2252/BmrU family lipid kinase
VKILFLVNARSGARRGWDVGALIREHAQPPYEIRPCERKEDLDAIADEAERSGFDVIYAVGGDGTVHEVAKRLLGRSIALGILPTGSGNGFARHIQLPMEPRAGLRASSKRRIAIIDTAIVNGLPFLGTMGLGFDALIAERFAASDVRGFRTYARIGFGAFFEYQPADYEIVIDGQTFHRRAFCIAICNSSQYGNNATMAPQASVIDGILDVVMIDDVSLIGAMLLLPRLLNRTIDRSKKVTIARGRHIEIRRENAGAAHLDGEPVTLPESMTIDVVPGSLRVLLPDACGKI